MKINILNQSTDLFLEQGFKTTTMDFLAESMSVSKKTLYKHFKNKSDLIDQAIGVIHLRMSKLMESNRRTDLNAIAESFYIKDKMSELFSANDHKSMVELQQYYPELHKKHNSECSSLIYNHFNYIIRKGQASGHFYSDVNIMHVSQFYFTYALQLYNENNFETFKTIERSILQYHFRGISTEKGRKELNKQLLDYDKR